MFRINSRMITDPGTPRSFASRCSFAASSSSSRTRLLVIFEGVGIARLDRESQVVWARLNRAHHVLDPEGEIYVLTRESRVEPSFRAEVATSPGSLVGRRL